MYIMFTLRNDVMASMSFFLRVVFVIVTCQGLAIPAPTSDKKESLSYDNFTHHEALDENYHLYWNANATHIVFKTRVKTNGYIGFGISPNGGMPGSDIVIGWVKDGVTHWSDRHADGKVMPQVDAQHNWQLLSGVEEGGHTSLVFVRRLDTCDPDDRPINTGTTRVIFSYHPVDPGADDRVPYHGASRRGTKSIYLLDSPIAEKDGAPLPNDVFTVDFLNENFSVPGNDTYYNCRVMKLPNLTQKHHMIRYEPLIQVGHTQLVHHLVLFYCLGTVDDKYVGREYNCDDGTPEDLRVCDQVFIAWAVGGQPFNYPVHVGHPVGTTDNPGFFMLETHYNNPGLKTEYVDGSGLRLFLTKQLRQFDAAIIDTGVNTDTYQIVPPHYKSFISSGHCHHDCLAQGLGSKEIHVFANLLHGHLLARKLRTRHFRNGIELSPLLEDNNYDFNYQEMRVLKEERTIKAGDSLITDCDYDSTSHKDITYGGLPSTSEMCQAFLLYYPKVALSRCVSRIRYKLTGPAVQSNVLDTVRSLNWTDADVRDRFRQDAYSSPIIEICYTNATQFTINLQAKPNITQEYQPPTLCSN
ncbi:unnamed protein product [Lymnaea stagnalis]|uniref:DOMON domain-containing protein n=1 Tax=Lymnaea stagnalis TaxID=6523 RepID=A0AAV2I7J8_LYMST